MSPNVGNFVHDLVEMAKAMETLPQVEQERDQLKAEVGRLSQSVQDRELAIVNYKNNIETLVAKVRATEAERDDAEMRFLELDEKAHKVMGRLDAIINAATSSQTELTPPKPQPEPEPVQPPVPEAVHSIEAQDQSATLPTTSSENTPTGDGEKLSSEAPSTGQSEENPTSGQYVSQSATGVGTSTTENALLPANPSGPYTNKRYHDHPVYVSLWDWIDGGGTEESYRWHPNWVPGSIA